MNVAITRAKHFLWIVGNEKCLLTDPNWGSLTKTGCQKTYSFAQSPFTKEGQGDYNH